MGSTRIRASERAERRSRTPILAVTASTLEEQEVRSRAVGMDGFITKPIGIEELRATLDAQGAKDGVYQVCARLFTTESNDTVAALLFYSKQKV